MNNTQTIARKITRTTFRSFVKQNAGKLLVQNFSDFDPMKDCVTSCADRSFHPAELTSDFAEHTFGIKGVWLAGAGRDWFSDYAAGGLVGICVCNACGSFVVAVRS